jgi:hypothetical protein
MWMSIKNTGMIVYFGSSTTHTTLTNLKELNTYMKSSKKDLE